MFHPVTIKNFMNEKECEEIVANGNSCNLMASQVGKFGVDEKESAETPLSVTAELLILNAVDAVI